jgi:hypothetical protein
MEEETTDDRYGTIPRYEVLGRLPIDTYTDKRNDWGYLNNNNNILRSKFKQKHMVQRDGRKECRSIAQALLTAECNACVLQCALSFGPSFG